MSVRRLLTLLLALVMTFSLMSVLSACDGEDDRRSSSRKDDDDDDKPRTVDLEDLEWESTDSGIKLTNYTGDARHVVLPDSIDGKKIVSLGTAFAGNVEVETLVLGKYIEVLNFEWINDCDALVRLEGPGVTDITENLYNDHLEELILPELEDLSLRKIDSADALRYLEIPNVRYIRAWGNSELEVEYWPESLEEVVIPENMLVRIGGEYFEDYEDDPDDAPYVAMGGLAIEDYLDDDEDLGWGDFECAAAFHEFQDNKDYVYCNFFQHDEIIVNGEKYTLD